MLNAVEPRSHHESHSVRYSFFGFLALFAILAGINYFISPSDIGWFAVNPTPFLLIPALLGVRYGFRAGLRAGLLSALFLLVGRHVLSHGVRL